jgi:hypothetical protein
MRNEGKMDRIWRVVAGIVFFILASTVFTGTMSTVFYVLGVVMLVTAATGFCALYKLFGINTDKK